MKNMIWLLICVWLISCDRQESKKETQEIIEIELPYYNEPTFTPEWIEEDAVGYNKIHSIANFKFQNQNGNWIEQSDLDGKLYVANFFFSICPNVCPLMTGNLLKVQEAFQSNPNVKILSHTVMPWLDSVGRLKEYAVLNGIDDENWSLLTGDKNDIYQLARSSYFADEGFGKTVTEEDDFLHTENLVLIDQNRHIRGIYNGTLSLETKQLIEDIKSLLE
jgi:protein SCO1/2